MLKRFNTLFSKNTDPLKSLSPEESQRIQSFSDNLDTLDNTTNDSNRLSYFRRIISSFQGAFQHLTPWQSQTERIKGIYSRFTTNLFNNILLQSVFENHDMYVPLFKCLVIMSHQNNDVVPHSSKFIPFFCQLIKSMKNSEDNRLLKASFEFLTILFKDNSFFNEFLEADGFTLIFTSFFLTNNKEPIDAMMNLLFCVVPPQFYKDPSMTTIAIVLDALKTDFENSQNTTTIEQASSKCSPKCATFLVHYLCSLYPTCDTIFDTFQLETGFLILNNFLKTNCTYKEAIDCYKLMFIKTENNPAIIQSIYDLYIDSPPDFQTNILKLLLGLPAQDVQNVVPVVEWITDESKMTDEQIELVCRIMLNLKNYNDYIPFVLTILEKPSIRFEVCDIFLDLLQMLVATKKMPVEALVDKKFLETFIFNADRETFTKYMTKHPSIPHILLAIYTSPLCTEYQFTIISKLVSNFDPNFTVLLKRLCKANFSLEIYNLLLNNLSKQEIIDLVIYETRERPNAFHLFLQCNGFEIFEVILNGIEDSQDLIQLDQDEKEEEEKKKKNKMLAESIVKIIGALTTYGPRPRIDEWINSLPIESPFFTMVDKETLAKVAVNEELYLNVPSLLPFIEKFDFTSPLCLFNAGKFGIPMFLKREIPVSQVPYLDRISNRYAPPTIMKYLFSQVDKMDSFVDITVPQYPIFELVPTKRPKTQTLENATENSNEASQKSTDDDILNRYFPASLAFKSPTNQTSIQTVSFEFFIPSLNDNSTDISKNRLTIFSCAQIMIYLNDSIINFQTNKGKASLFYKKGEPNTIQLQFSFSEVEGKLNGQPIDRLKNDQGYPNEILFGDPIKPSQVPRLIQQTPTPNMRPIYLNRNLLINDQLPKIFESTQTVYTVGYLGFASYYSNMKELEILFLILEKAESTQKFSTIYLTLLHIQKSRNIEKLNFWMRLILSVKRANSSIHDNLLLYFHQLPASVYDENDYTFYLISILSDFELYFVINKTPLLSFLSLVESYLGDSTSGINLQLLIGRNGMMITRLIYIIRSGVAEEIRDKLLSIVSIMLSMNEENEDICIREFLYNALTVGDWSLQLPLDYEQFPVRSLLPLPIPESRFQKRFFRIFLNSINAFNNQNGSDSNQITEIFPANTLLQFSLLFDDINRSLFFFKLVSIYSSKNPKYITNSKLAAYAFSQKALHKEAWIEAFAILQGKVSTNDLLPHKKSKSKSKPKAKSETVLELPRNLVIKRPIFIEAILAMLNTLMAYEANKSIEILEERRKRGSDDSDSDSEEKPEQKDETNNLVNEIMETMTKFQESDYSYFTGNFAQLAHLSNLGLVPCSVVPSLSNPRGRVENDIKIDDVHLIDAELKAISDNTRIYKHPDIVSATFPVEFKQHPFDVKGISWTERLPFDNVILFLTNVLCSIENNSNFNSSFSTLAFGSTLMYGGYSYHFIREFISQVLIHYTQSDTMKPCPLSVALKAAKGSAFEDNYLDFLSLAVSLMKRRFDSSIIKDFREVILLAFHFISDEDDRADLDKFFNSFKSVVFHPAVLDDATFCHFLKYHNVHATMNPKYLQYYDPNETEKKWNDYINNNVSPNFDCDSRSALTTQVVTYLKLFAQQGSKFMLSARISRICNHYNKTHLQASMLNIYLRKYENFFFKCLQYEIFYKHFAFTFFNITNPESDSKDTSQISEKAAKSFHLSMLFMPYASPRVITQSPFEIKSPPKGSKVPTEYFKYPTKTPTSKIAQVEFNGELQCAPEWFMEQRQFEYSFVLHSSSLLLDFQAVFGKFSEVVQVYLYYFIHPVPCVLFFNNDKMCLLLLSTINENQLGLVAQPHAPIALIPFNESCFLNEWHSVSLFCGHFVLTFESSRFIKVEPHFYVHRKRALSFFYMFDPNFVIIFDSMIDYENIDKRAHNIPNVTSIAAPFSSASSSNTIQNYISSPNRDNNSNLINHSPSSNNNEYTYKYFSFVNNSNSNSHNNSGHITISMSKGFNYNAFLFNINFVDCLKAWLDNRISTYDYLIFLNYQSGRAFSDCTQYPVFPWVIAPSLEENRKMELPMGQQNEKRAQHYDETYKESLEPNKYFYGCHYSLPGAVFWFMMRVPPFSYLLWDMNEGWDDNQRMFYSINDSYLSASLINQTDLKEPIPEIYTVPELYVNLSKLDIIDDRQNVILPDWADQSPILFTEVFRKYLEKNDEVNCWIDLIFGYKQQGEAALKAKNLFLPSAYHSSTADSLMIDANAYEDQVINFGQCPRQLFSKEHPPRNRQVRNNIRTLTQKITPQQIDLYYNTQQTETNVPLHSSNSSTSNLFLLTQTRRCVTSSSSFLSTSSTNAVPSPSSSSGLRTTQMRSRRYKPQLKDQPSSLPTNTLLLANNPISSAPGSLDSAFNNSPVANINNSSDNEANLGLLLSDNDSEASIPINKQYEGEDNRASIADSYTAMPRRERIRSGTQYNRGSTPPTPAASISLSNSSIIPAESHTLESSSSSSRTSFNIPQPSTPTKSSFASMLNPSSPTESGRSRGRTLLRRGTTKAPPPPPNADSNNNNKQQQQNKNYENSLMFSSYVPYSVSFINQDDFKLGKNATVLPEKSVSVPPSFDYFITLEGESETVSVRKTINHDMMCSISSSEFGFIHSMSISDDGVFMAISFESGYVKVYFIYYELKVPRYIEHVASFIGPCGCRCKMSCLLSPDFICASQFGSEIIMWNFATGYVHRVIDFSTNRSRSFSNEVNNNNNDKKININELFNYYEDDSNSSENPNMPIDMLFDTFDGSLSILFNNRVEQFSINGKKTRTYHYQNDNNNNNDDFEFTCFALFPFDFTFDGRLLIVGNNKGGIDFLVASSNDVENFTLIGSKNHLFKSAVKSIFVCARMAKVWACDDKKHAVELTIPIFEGVPRQSSLPSTLSPQVNQPENEADDADDESGQENKNGEDDSSDS
ncbi:hypothetical protein M9Y10_010350 [Tritrichomonas musculus]|uniref:BEACH domain-containing protein n=1 Tax=Tritrichomonas musculus TaxID=1915356 RepID=A0ABR2IKH8_9EUKA